MEKANAEEYWRYFISQALRLALSLIFEDVPHTTVGIILPLKRTENAVVNLDPQKLVELGECLISWRDQDHTFHTFYEAKPVFESPFDFRIRGLRAEYENEPKDRTFLILQGSTRILRISQEVVETVRLLLAVIYEESNTWLPYFAQGVSNTIYGTSALSNINNPYSIMMFLADMVVRLGGKTAEGKDRWKFCCVLIPRSLDLPFQMRTLVVQAQSSRSPHIIDETSISPEATILSLGLRAFQSIHMLFRSPISSQDTTIGYLDTESYGGEINSAIAMPIGGEVSVPLGVLYVTSEWTDMFGKPYQRILRLMGKIMAELLEITRVRKQSEERLRDIIAKPRVVNRTLESYDSENKFTGHIEALLRSIRETNNPDVEGNSSFIAIDIDNLSSTITNTYGDQIAINLSKQLGDRLRNQMGLLFSKSRYQIYHAYADRFYIMLRDTLLDQARETTKNLQIALSGLYNVSILPLSTYRERGEVELRITVRLAVSSYKHKKLYEILQRYPTETQLADVRSDIPYYLDLALNVGRQKGGNCIISWYYPKPPSSEHGYFDLWPPKVEHG